MEKYIDKDVIVEAIDRSGWAAEDGGTALFIPTEEISLSLFDSIEIEFCNN